MAHSHVIDSAKYALYVKVLAGQGDGPIITVTPDGHIHIGPDPRPLAQVSQKLQAAIKQIQAGVAAFAEAAVAKA